MVTPSAIELLTAAARPILERWFESEVLKATLATDAIIGAFSSISAPGTAYVLLHHVMGEAGGARGVWGYVRGGMGGLAEALDQACEHLGVTVVREAEVVKIPVEQGKARGVVLADHRFLEADIVASSVDAHWTFERFVAAEESEETATDLYTETKSKSDELIADRLHKLGPYEFQDMVAAVLRAMGLRTRISEPGPDRGVDIERRE